MLLNVQKPPIDMYSEILDTANKIINLCITSSYEIKDSIDPKPLEAYINHYNSCHKILAERRLKIIDNYRNLVGRDIEQIRRDLEDDKRIIKALEAELNTPLPDSTESHKDDGSQRKDNLNYNNLYFNHLEWIIYFPSLYEYIIRKFHDFLSERVISPLKNVFSGLLNTYLE